MDNAFRILEQVGFANATPHCIETCTAAGAVLGDDGRLRMPLELVQHILQLARRNLVLHGQDPRWDLDLSGARMHFSTAGAAVMAADSENGLYRDSEAQDLYDMARIADTCEHIHMFQRTCVPRDIADNYALDINTLYCCVMGTSKHVGSSWTLYPHLEKSLEMLSQSHQQVHLYSDTKLPGWLKKLASDWVFVFHNRTPHPAEDRA